MKIEDVRDTDYLELLEVWEDAVRATHHFLTEQDIQAFKPLILAHGFPAVKLKCVRDQEGILGFIGMHEQKVEMLFLRDRARAKGTGKMLLHYAIKVEKCYQVDVNEQNPQAVGFYQYCGFEVVKRSDLDDAGRPFPILHLQLSEQKRIAILQD